MLISATGSRFPRATLQLPQKQKPLPAGADVSVGRVSAAPVSNFTKRALKKAG